MHYDLNNDPVRSRVTRRSSVRGVYGVDPLRPPHIVVMIPSITEVRLVFGCRGLPVHYVNGRRLNAICEGHQTFVPGINDEE